MAPRRATAENCRRGLGEGRVPREVVAEAVAESDIRVHRIAVREIPRSGKPEELLDRFGLSARHIIDAVRTVAAGKALSAR